MGGYWLRRIEQLDPVTDHHEIYRISIGFEFPWDYYRALEFALFRTYCVPSISRLLDATGEFANRPQKRYDDTALLMGEIAEHGYDSPRGRAALSVINRQHGRYAISNDDMLYVLSTFIYDPIDWIGEFGWRPLHEHERQAAFHYFREVGKRMAISGIPEDFDEFRAFKTKYERENFRFSPTNQRIGTYTLNLFCSWYPKPLRPTVGVAVRSLLDELMLTAFGFDPAPEQVARRVRAGVRARSAVVRLLPRRRRSKLLKPASRSYPGYPDGYHPGDLGAPGPPSDIDRDLLRRPR
jgi:hypothetical protein